MANTTNFGWETPDDSDLVKDGAAAMRTLGSAIDTSLVDLKGGTTGQVLSKTSNTDMDFTWVTSDDANAIQNAIVDAKGDLISATAADTPARLAVGTDGQVLTADSSTATGLKWAAAASGGGMTLISTTTLSGATVTLSSIPQTYKSLFIIITGMTANTSNRRFRMLPNNTNNICDYSMLENASGLTYKADVLRITDADTTRTNDANAWAISISNYTSTTAFKPFDWRGRFIDSGGLARTVFGGGAIITTSAISSLVFDYEGTNTFAGGTILFYGVS